MAEREGSGEPLGVSSQGNNPLSRKLNKILESRLDNDKVWSKCSIIRKMLSVHNVVSELWKLILTAPGMTSVHQVHTYVAITVSHNPEVVDIIWNHTYSYSWLLCYSVYTHISPNNYLGTRMTCWYLWTVKNTTWSSTIFCTPRTVFMLPAYLSLSFINNNLCIVSLHFRYMYTNHVTM